MRVIFCLSFIGGLLTCLILSARLTPLAGTQSFIKSRGGFFQYEFFNPFEKGDIQGVAIVGNCHVSSISLYNKKNNLDKFQRPTRDPAANIANLMNLALDKFYQPAAVKFYNLSVMGSGSGFEDHLFFIYHALESHRIDTIIYTNFFSFTHQDFYDFDSAEKNKSSALESAFILEKWAREVPEVKELVQRYLEILQDDAEYRAGVQFFGEEWRRNVDPRSMLVSDMRPWAFARRHLVQLHNFLQAFVFNFSKQQEFAAVKLKKLLEEQLQENLSIYKAPFNDKKFLIRQSPVNHQLEIVKNSFYKRVILWYSIISIVAQAKGVKFVVYFPPNLSMDREYYQKFYFPKIIHPLMQSLSASKILFLDQLVNNTLNKYDFAWRNFGTAKYALKVGHEPNIVGNFKRGINLIEALRTHGILQHVIRNSVSYANYFDDLDKGTLEAPESLGKITDKLLGEFIGYGF